MELSDLKVGQFYRNKNSGDVCKITAIGEQKILVKRIKLADSYNELTHEYGKNIKCFLEKYKLITWPQEVWINLFKLPPGKILVKGGYDTKESADLSKTIKIEGFGFLERFDCQKVKITQD